MIRMLPPFLLGVFVTTVMLLLFKPMQGEPSAVLDSAGRIGTSPTPPPAVESSSDRIRRAEAISEFAGSTQPIDSSESLEQGIRRQLDNAHRALFDANVALEEFELDKLQERPVVSPVSLAPEFSRLLDFPFSPVRMEHELIQREQRDEPWATATESYLLNLIYEQATISQRYAPPRITCAATLCEVAIIGYEVPTTDATKDFFELSQKLGNETDAEIFDAGWGTSPVYYDPQEGVATFIQLLRRKPEA